RRSSDLLHLAYRNERKVFLRPHFRQIERMKTIGLRLFFRHDLYVQFPFWKILSFDCIKQVALRRLTVFSDNIRCLFIREILDPLFGTEVKLHPMTYIVFIDKASAMAS